MDSHDMRNMLLSELIDKMHARMADKMFPPNPDEASEPAALGASPIAHESTEVSREHPEHNAEAEITDEELEELTKKHAK